jgi:hypothetical protein
VRLQALCAIGVSAGLLSCWGLASDGLERDGSRPGFAGAPPVAPRETCEDNPLLAECARDYRFCREDPGNPDCASAPESDLTDDEPQPVVYARNILSIHCGQCHGSGLTAGQASASINYIDDWSRLLRAGLIQKCSPERSPIIAVMRTGDMPPPDSLLSGVLDDDIEAVEDAIDLDCGDE